MISSRFYFLPLAASCLFAWTARGQSDSFDDNVTGPAWTVLQDDAARLSIAEQNQRLEVTASGPTDPNLDAIYLSNGPAGFRLSTSQDFQLSVAYSFTTAASTGGVGSSLALVFGVGRDLDGTDSAAIGYGYINGPFGTATALGVASRTDDVQMNMPLAAGPSSGIFTIAYNAAGDDLTLGVGTVTYTLNDTVRGSWGADSLYASFGARGSGFDVLAGNAILDNFSVDSGLVVPEPSSAVVLGFGGLAGMLALGRRARRQRN